MAYTLNNLKDLLNTFANNHLQIKRFGFGEIYDINQTSSDANTFPMLWAQVVDVKYPLRNDIINTKIVNLNIICMDILKNGKENEVEIWSDQQQIAEDLLRYLYGNQTNLYQIIDNPQITLFTEKHADYLAGAVLNVSIAFYFDITNCQIPLK